MTLTDDERTKLARFLGRLFDSIVHTEANILLACLERAAQLERFIQLERWITSRMTIQGDPESQWHCMAGYRAAATDVYAHADSAPLAVVRAVIQLPEAQEFKPVVEAE